MKNNLSITDYYRCEILKPPSFGIVVFGASGHLAYNKLFPSLFGLYKKGIIKNNFFIVGTGRSNYDDSSFRNRIENSIKSKFPNVEDRLIGDFCINVYYINGNYEDTYYYENIKGRLKQLTECYKTGGNIIYHLATPPFLFETIIYKLIKSSLITKDKDKNYFERLMVEKPFGLDFESCKELNKVILRNLNDNQIFRIDHYLGKSTVQNILVFKFANTLFHDLWNKKNIEYVFIKFKEREGVEERQEYFDNTGLLRDIFQNHILQLVALIAMEKPESFSAENIQKQKNKIFKSIAPFEKNVINKNILLGQYNGYRQRSKEFEKSCIETFFFTRLFINNRNWKNVPFYILAGKKMDVDETSITVVFKREKKCLLCEGDNLNNKNAITFKIKPSQGVSIRFVGKVPGAKLCTGSFNMEFNYKDVFGNEMIEDYESVILECLYGDHTIFWDKEGVEYSWKILQPLLEKLNNCPLEEKNKTLKIYEPGSEGPIEIINFIKDNGWNL
ncbi:MAG: glucose-6-phosphate dehydrogenase [Candidatus Goldbacteria bacterium]|nr:glucose-6-phosphate dehydrogenase [Candidatus Goldiibacteriota bacterium]